MSLQWEEWTGKGCCDAPLAAPSSSSSTPPTIFPSSFSQAKGLLLALLRGSSTTLTGASSCTEAPPLYTSLLLCGMTGSGKTHLCEEVVRYCESERHKDGCSDMEAPILISRDNVASAGSTSGRHLCCPPLHTEERQGRQRVITVSPSLAIASVYRDKKSNSTTLRRNIIEEIVKAAPLDSSRVHYSGGKTSKNASDSNNNGMEKENVSVLILLDHLELFLYASDDGGGRSTAGESGDKNAGYYALTASDHPELLTDVYTLNRSSPPLLTDEEKRRLGIDRIVVVGCFSGETEEVHPVLVKSFDLVISLPTPTQVERETFFVESVPMLLLSTWKEGGGVNDDSPLDAERDHSPGCESNDDDSDEILLTSLSSSPAAQSLSSAIALRTGGVTYQGLLEVLHILNGELGIWWGSQHVQSYRGKKKISIERLPELLNDMECGSLAQRVVQTFQRSPSISAALFRTSAGYVDVQVTRWTDIAGLHTAKKELQEMVMRPLLYQPAYLFFGVRPSTGILLYGPPGTGKTMLAKAMATELNASFVYMDLPGLIKAEVGESEKKLTAFFAAARERSPSVVFIDELQAAFGIRYQEHSNAGGNALGVNARATRSRVGSNHESRLVSHLFQCIDAAREDTNCLVIVVGATNVIEHLDPLLLRAGRLDTHVAVPLPDEEARTELVRRIIFGDWAHWFSVPWEEVTVPAPSCPSIDVSQSSSPDGGKTNCLISDALLEKWESVLVRKNLWRQCTLPKVEEAEKDDSVNERSAQMIRHIQRLLRSSQEALMQAFVTHSDNLSGAEIRNSTTIFAIEFLKEFSSSLSSPDSSSLFLSLSSPVPLPSSPELPSEALEMLSLLVFDWMVEGKGSTESSGDAHLSADGTFLNTTETPKASQQVVQRVQLKGKVLLCVNAAIGMLKETKARSTSFYE